MDLSSGKEEPGITDPWSFPPNTNSHSALLWVQLNTLIHASTIHKQESILYPLQHPMRPIWGCQPEEAPSRLVASAIIFSSDREAPSGHAPHTADVTRMKECHELHTDLKQASEKFSLKNTSKVFCILEMSTTPSHAWSVMSQIPISSFEPVIDRQESPHITLRISCNKNKPGPTWIRVSVSREAISFIFSLINTAAFSD